MDKNVDVLATDGQDYLYAGGDFTFADNQSVNYIAQWHGNSWLPLGAGMAPAGSDVVTLAVDASGNLFAAGLFSTAGGTPANNIAVWNRTNWIALGSGVNNPVYASTLDSLGHLYVGGNFTAAGQNPSPNAAEANVGIFTQPPGSSSFVRPTDGLLTLVFQGHARATYIVQASQDAINWMDISTNVCGTNGLWSVTNAVASSREYFRARTP
jgi:hypothetical protein